VRGHGFLLLVSVLDLKKVAVEKNVARLPFYAAHNEGNVGICPTPHPRALKLQEEACWL
jgi:hypothetical protein